MTELIKCQVQDGTLSDWHVPVRRSLVSCLDSGEHNRLQISYRSPKEILPYILAAIVVFLLEFAQDEFESDLVRGCHSLYDNNYRQRVVSQALSSRNCQ